MSLTHEFSDCCLEIPNHTPSSLLTSPPALDSQWHRLGERILRRFRFVLRSTARTTPK